MKVLFVTAESAPFAKTGGLGDVSAALPAALAAKRVGARVIMPLYGTIAEEWRAQMHFVKYIYVPLAWRSLYCGLFELKHNNVLYYFIDNEYYFKRGELYGLFDDGERFAFFSKAVVALLPELGWTPDVLHCNDWQTALVPLYMHFSPLRDNVKTVFTIHNIEYQGRYARSLLEDVFDLPAAYFNGGMLEFNGGLNLMKGAIEAAHAVTTVSPTYSEELEYGFYAKGLEGVIAAHRHKMTGILNGIDTVAFDPKTNQSLIENYDVDSLEKKLANKLELQKLLGLTISPDIPLIAMVSRLVEHKGMDLIEGALEEIMDMDLQFAVVGLGDWRFEQLFKYAQSNYPGRFAASIGYNENLATKVYAGADIFLMPSRSEPCGLSQMIAMRYGTVPLVRETGGLKDTVMPYDPETGEGTGFLFPRINCHDMLDALRQAVGLYRDDRPAWKKLQENGMRSDFGWASSAQRYSGIYRSVTGAK